MISKKKGLHKLWMSSKTKKLHNSGPNNGKSFTTSVPKSRWGGAVLIFGAKIGLKSTQNVLFCILFRLMGRLQPPPYIRYSIIHLNCSSLLIIPPKLQHSFNRVMLTYGSNPLANPGCSCKVLFYPAENADVA